MLECLYITKSRIRLDLLTVFFTNPSQRHFLRELQRLLGYSAGSIRRELLKFQKENSFKAPPKEWINHRLENLRDTLNQNTVSSALALKELMGPITLEPVLTKDADLYQLVEGNEKDFRPYYVAHSKIRTLALLDDERKGSNWLQWRWVYHHVRTMFE